MEPVEVVISFLLGEASGHSKKRGRLSHPAALRVWYSVTFPAGCLFSDVPKTGSCSAERAFSYLAQSGFNPAGSP